MDKNFIKLVQTRTAELAIGPSTLRNQGARGAVVTARSFLKGLNLRLFSVDSPAAFKRSLDKATTKLRAALPAGARNWGAARKALNIFLRDVLYCQYLCSEFDFLPLEEWLELPLDSEVAKGLRGEPEGKALTRWPGVKHLDIPTSREYQEVAERVAKRLHIARIHLDLIYWRRKKVP